ncbi:hypothetical protein [Mucilaginibacter paludis]|nr:hypothetical protein [Mucilaginibacter paludis]
MYPSVTVDEAIKKGKRIVAIPVLCIMLGSFFLTALLYTQIEFSTRILVACLLGSFAMPWLYWSVMITRWRIWAFENVRNVHELKKRAIKEQLIWKDGSFFENTEIRTADRQKIQILQDKFKKPDVFIDDISVPGEILICYSARKAVFLLLMSLLIAGGATCLMSMKYTRIFSIALIGVALIMAYGAVKKMNNKLPQIILGNQGIQSATAKFYAWSEVVNEDVIAVQSGKTRRYFLVYNYPLGKQRIDIGPLNISRRRLEHLLRIYRGRVNGVKANH